MRTLGMDKDELEYFMSLVLEGLKKCWNNWKKSY